MSVKASREKLKSPLSNLEGLICELRGERVLLDSVVADLYGVPTKRVNESVARNRGKFPRGYVLSLTVKEWDLLKSHPATSTGDSVSPTRKGGKVKRPKAFTERGLYMLATILKSKQATRATLEIIETFTQLRQFSRVAQALAQAKEPSEQKDLIGQSGALMGDILNRSFSEGAIESSETTVELNLAMLKVTHTVKQNHEQSK